MPIYEYGCEACGHEFEVTQRMTDEPLRTCPACHKDDLHKLISATSFVLKGSGWYKDGYGSKKSGGERTENQRSDRLQKALDDDKKKSAGGSSASDASSSGASTSDTGTSSAGSSGSGSSGSGSSGSGSSGGGMSASAA